MLLATLTEESNKQKSENQALQFQANDLTLGIVSLSTLWLKALKTLFLLPSHIIKFDLEAFPFLIRFCPVLLLNKYFALNTTFFSSQPLPLFLFCLCFSFCIHLLQLRSVEGAVLQVPGARKTTHEIFKLLALSSPFASLQSWLKFHATCKVSLVFL